MSSKRDYYEILGVPRTADANDIKLAYRKLARQHHPDVAENKKEAESHFKEINEAFAVLSNAEKRDQYDRFGHAGVEQTGGNGFGFNFSSGFDMFDDIIGSFFGDAGRGQGRANRGHDLRYDLEISLEEAYTGITKEVSIQAPAACSECKGTGAKDASVQTCRTCHGAGQVRQIQQSIFGRIVRASACPECHGQGQTLKDPCGACRGSGQMETRRKITVQIPAGVDDENRIRLSGEGEAGLRGAPTGDLYIFIHVKPHSKFKREERNVFHEASISFVEAALGNEIEVPTLAGKETLHIPTGTQNGATFRLKGKGMPSVNGFSHGDQYVVVRVDVPKKLTEKQKRLLHELAESSGVKLSDKSFLGRVKDALG